MSDTIVGIGGTALDARATEIRDEHLRTRRVRIDRMFCGLLLVQYVAGIIGALTVSPYAWEGKVKTIHLHVWVAALGGAGIIILPIVLAIFRPGSKLTRHVIAASQMLSSALLIHLTGGRIETHFHVFGSLAFLAFYLDWTVITTATVVVAADHFLRGIFWPESVTYWLSRQTTIDPSKINIEIQQPDMPLPLDLGEPSRPQ